MRESSQRFTDKQIQTINDILIAAGQVTAGSVAAPFLFPSVDKPPWPVLLFGLVSTFILWLTPILLARRIKRI